MVTEKINPSEIFGIDVFSDKVMKERLAPEVYEEFHKTVDEGANLSSRTAEAIAAAIKDWAIEQGATHYTHWFQPLTGATAEKHDSFISAPHADGTVSMEFSGKCLIKGETDGSSFPSGGLRATFEARGYTLWDCTSPVFVRHDAAGATLCIPTAFCSYTGEALDQKTPLLRSMQAVGAQALRLIRLMGNTTSKKVDVSVGAEQEYFLVDKKKYLQRPDLVYAGRTLFGAPAPKGQELDDHYFGNIRERVAAFMKDVNVELWRLGVSSKTQHNEVAPAQHELAPIYATCNIAVDHNQLIMEVLKKVADRHGMHCLLHEKPFAGLNGSGKHDNWSLCTDDGINLLDPGKTPHENIQFLLMLTCVMRAVDRHAELLRESASNPGNDARLGGNEAPPSIISIFLGQQLEDVLDQLISTGTATHSIKGGKLMTDIKSIPNLNQDATDRNRTSPFAFTGNKFEFRTPGSRDSVAPANVVINTIVAETLAETCDLIEAAENKEQCIHDLIETYAMEHRRIVFNGNGYSKEWAEEAARRGLPNVRSMVEAIPVLTRGDTVSMFEKFGVFSYAELESRADIKYENYAKAMTIEALTMIDMAGKQLIPAVIRYSGNLAQTINAMVSAGVDPEVEKDLLVEISDKLKEAKAALEALKSLVLNKELKKLGNKKHAEYIRAEVVPAMDALRKPLDQLEMLVDKKDWPIPTYGDLLFEV